jgi:hypothetical protein
VASTNLARVEVFGLKPAKMRRSSVKNEPGIAPPVKRKRNVLYAQVCHGYSFAALDLTNEFLSW